MTRLDKIAIELLLDIECAPSIEEVRFADMKLDAIKAAMEEYANGDTDEADKEFEVFWEKYGKKVGRTPALKKWKRLKKADRTAILTSVDAFVQATPDVQYRPHPLTYLNQRRWEDELPNAPKKKPTTQPSFVNTWDTF